MQVSLRDSIKDALGAWSTEYAYLDVGNSTLDLRCDSLRHPHSGSEASAAIMHVAQCPAELSSQSGVFWLIQAAIL